MGFFGDLKQDLSQAVNELLPDDKEKELEVAEDANEMDPEEAAILAELEALEAEEKAAKEPSDDNFADDIDLGKMLEELPEEDIAEDDVAEAAIDQAFADLDSMAVKEDTAKNESDSYLDDIRVSENNKGVEWNMDTERYISDETSVVTAGMKITGDLSTEGSLELLGHIKGNLDIAGKLNVTGHITGNSKANEVYAENAKIEGDINSETSVKIGAGTVIIGNITAMSAAIAGAVKGDIDVHGPVILDSSAIVMGNIKSQSVQINNGAAIEGICSQCYAEVSPTAFFDDYKPENISINKKSK